MNTVSPQHASSSTPRKTLRACLPGLLALLAVVSLIPEATAQQRTDNRRLFWTGSGGNVWDHSTESWKTIDRYPIYAPVGNQVAFGWSTTTALDNTQMLAGDVAIFDSASDITSFVDPDTGEIVYNPAPTSLRTIAVANEGVRVSDMIISGEGSFEFTGGAIISDPASITPGSVQLTGTSPNSLILEMLSPTGRLVKAGTGQLILSNTAANVFKGGIWLGGGDFVVTDARALGGNDIHLMRMSLSATTFSSPMTFINTGTTALGPGTALLSPVTLRVPASAEGLNITGNINLYNETLTFDIEGETTVSGRIIGEFNAYGASAGTIIKTGTGTLILSGTQNWFYGWAYVSSVGYTNEVQEGRLVVTNQYALGTGPFSISSDAILEFRGATGTLRQAFIGDGNIHFTEGSDITFNWRDGVLVNNELNVYSAPASNRIGEIQITGGSRFTALASGTYTSVLGGSDVQVFVSGNSTLALGREGISTRGTGGTKIPMSYPIMARRVSLTEGSLLVFNPNAFLSTSALDLSEGAAISFGASGVSQLRYQEGTDPKDFLYVMPHGMRLVAVNEIPIVEGYHREFVVLNQSANPLIDMAMTMRAISAIHDTLSTQLADEFLDPVAKLAPGSNSKRSKRHKWLNSAWLRYMQSELDYDPTDNAPGLDGRINGVVTGFDGILMGRLLLGLYAGIVDNGLDTTNSTRIDSKQKLLGVHAAQRFGRYYFALDITTGRVRTDTVRNEPSALVRGRWDTSYYSASAEIGAIFTPWAKTIIRPYAGLRYTHLKFSNFSERGASPLEIGNFNDSTSQAVFGVAASRQFILFKRNLAAGLLIGRKHAAKVPRQTLDTYFFDSPTTPVRLERGDFDSNFTVAGLSARMAVAPRTLIGLAFDYETSPSQKRMTGSICVGHSW